jgi:hypothetical protein
MGYLGYKPADKPLTAADITDSIITSAKITDATIVNGDIANSTINLTTKVTGTLPTTNGGTGLATIGTANQVLAVNSGATALEYQAVSSDFVLLATTTASSSASVSFDGYFSSTYKNYQIIYSDAFPATNSVSFGIRFRRSNADVTASNYSYAAGGAGLASNNSTASVDYNASANQSRIILNFSDLSNSNNFMYSGIIDIYDPLSTTRYKVINYKMGTQNGGGDYYFFGSGFGVLKDSLSALSGITFFMTSGNIATGTFKLYGIK